MCCDAVRKECIITECVFTTPYCAYMYPCTTCVSRLMPRIHKLMLILQVDHVHLEVLKHTLRDSLIHMYMHVRAKQVKHPDLLQNRDITKDIVIPGGIVSTPAFPGNPGHCWQVWQHKDRQVSAKLGCATNRSNTVLQSIQK